MATLYINYRRTIQGSLTPAKEDELFYSAKCLLTTISFGYVAA